LQEKRPAGSYAMILSTQHWTWELLRITLNKVLVERSFKTRYF
jgi:hypothetical protein